MEISIELSDELQMMLEACGYKTKGEISELFKKVIANHIRTEKREIYSQFFDEGIVPKEFNKCIEETSETEEHKELKRIAVNRLKERGFSSDEIFIELPLPIKDSPRADVIGVNTENKFAFECGSGSSKDYLYSEELRVESEKIPYDELQKKKCGETLDE